MRTLPWASSRTGQGEVARKESRRARPLRPTPGTVRPKPGGCPELASSDHWHKFAHPDTVPSCSVSPRSLSSWSQLRGTHQLPGAVAQRPDTAVAAAARWGPHIPGGPWLRGTRRWPRAPRGGHRGPNLAPCARAAGAAPPSVPGVTVARLVSSFSLPPTLPDPHPPLPAQGAGTGGSFLPSRVLQLQVEGDSSFGSRGTRVLLW